MSNELKRAIDILCEKNYTCVVCTDDKIYTSEEHGVKPLLTYLDAGTDFEGYSAADKVVGKAAAMIYILLGVREVYADVMSESAKALLDEYGIDNECGLLVKNIINRAGTGLCPMEQAVQNITDPKDAPPSLKEKINNM